MEEWENIPGFDGGYIISSYGKIQSKKLNYKNSKFLRSKIDDGYFRVSLSVNGKKRYYALHRLIALTFIPNPNNYPVVMHLDNNRLNNSISNLKWGTHKENSKQCYADGRNNLYLKLINRAK